jgi:AcrR family transcriptional regulator
MDVKGPPRRSRRAEQAAQTRRRVVAAATALFAEQGYAATTLEEIARHADVSVETIYKRFGNKVALLEAIAEPAIVGADDGGDLFDRTEITRIAATMDQRDQVRQLAALSRSILERVHAVFEILVGAAAADPRAAELTRQHHQRRLQGQRRYIDLLLANGPLRRGLTAEEAAATYSTLASPANFGMLVRDLGWSADQFQEWLDRTLARVLLDD